MQRRLVLAALVAASLALDGCADLPAIAPSTCGNGVVDPGEDCDTFAPTGLSCGAPGGKNGCRYSCAKTSAGTKATDCPSGWGCGLAGTCSAPNGSFAQVGEPLAFAGTRLAAGDFDGDHRADLLTLGALDAVGRSPGRVLFFDDAKRLAESYDIPPRLGVPALGDLDTDGLTDLAVAFPSGVGVMLGQRDRTLASVAYPEIQLPAATNVSIFPIRARAPAFDPVVILYTTTPGVTAVWRVPEQGAMPIAITSLPAPLTDVVAEPAVGEPLRGLSCSGPPKPSTGPLCSEMVVAFGGATNAIFGFSVCVDAAANLTLGVPPAAIAIGGDTVDGPPLLFDLNGDGHPDAVLATRDAKGNAITRVAYGDGKGAFFGATDLKSSPSTSVFFPVPSIGKARHPLVIGCLDGDTKPDFVFPNGVVASALLSTQPPDQAGYSFAHHTPSGDWSTAHIADFNRDGVPDIVAAVAAANEIDFLVGDGAGSLVPQMFTATSTISHLATGDFDGDLVPDLAFSETGLHPEDGALSDLGDSLSVVYGRAGGYPDAPISLGRFGRIQQIRSGRVDIAVPMNDSSSLDALGVVSLSEDSSLRDIAVLYGIADRHPVAPFGLNDVTHQLRGEVVGLSVGHFHPDGHSHIAALGIDLDDQPLLAPASYRLWLARIGPDAQLIGETSSAVAPEMGALQTGRGRFGIGATLLHPDLDGDGLEEVVWIADDRGRPSGGAVVVWRSSCAGDACAFQPDAPQPFDLSARSYAARVADFDADGRVDLAVLRFGTPTGGVAKNDVLVFWNDGRGGLDVANPTTVTFSTPIVAIDVVRADTDPEPSLALVATTASSSDLTIALAKLRQRSPVTKTVAQITSGSGCSPDHAERCAIAAGDWDGDGVRDLAVSDGQRIALLRGQKK